MAKKITESLVKNMPAGGALIGKKNGKTVLHNKGSLGGYAIGKSHDNGGIMGEIVGGAGNPLEMQGNEVVITAPAVADTELHEFDGEKLTQRQILSRINVNGGGVSFEEGGEIKNVLCSGQQYKYGGQLLSDYEIVHACGCKHAMARGGKIEKSLYNIEKSKQPGSTETIVPDIQAVKFSDLSTIDHQLLYQFFLNPDTTQTVEKSQISNNFNELKKYGYLTFSNNPEKFGFIDIRLTNYGQKMIGNYIPANEMKFGGTVSDTQKKEYQYFKGVDYSYKNPYELNKAIEEYLDHIYDSNISLNDKEKVFISYYSGYGGLQKYGAEGKGLLFEYFTPAEIAKKMWGAAYKYGYSGGLFCEPSVGIGEFLKYGPDPGKATCYEINSYSVKICRILFPTADVHEKSFETLFIKNNSSIKNNIGSIKKFDLVIGNPPYGSFEGKYAGMGEAKYTRASNYIDYFIYRGLDILNKNGLLIFIIGTEVAVGGKPWLSAGITPIKKEIMQKAELLDAWRLPNGVFDRTDVLSDIIVLRKK